jgi:hypothetical protein
MNGIACGGERPRQEASGRVARRAQDARVRNSPRAQRAVPRLRDAMNGIACGGERPRQEASGRVARRAQDARVRNSPRAQRAAAGVYDLPVAMVREERKGREKILSRSLCALRVLRGQVLFRS